MYALHFRYWRFFLLSFLYLMIFFVALPYSCSCSCWRTHRRSRSRRREGWRHRGVGRRGLSGRPGGRYQESRTWQALSVNSKGSGLSSHTDSPQKGEFVFKANLGGLEV